MAWSPPSSPSESPVFEQAIRSLKERVDQLHRAGVLVVLDTNVYLQYPQELHESRQRPWPARYR
ncbi:hypothetical protein DKT69_20950 [Micromonospora sicca]|uniref:Uncharacterized protein n=1 Tax=Micromonospora sicca TaxID=2202420 RepID=A0A317DFA0_9ACTN|nr:hypothetical protein [Micromonospora sp. 4G51]PWR13391.1 hypothetical protein DKT69_20950 [Micromonospora sp. 4G51]